MWLIRLVQRWAIYSTYSIAARGHQQSVTKTVVRNVEWNDHAVGRHKIDNFIMILLAIKESAGEECPG